MRLNAADCVLHAWRSTDHDKFSALLDEARGGKPAATFLDQRRRLYQPCIRMDLCESGKPGQQACETGQNAPKP